MFNLLEPSQKLWPCRSPCYKVHRLCPPSLSSSLPTDVSCDRWELVWSTGRGVLLPSNTRRLPGKFAEDTHAFQVCIKPNYISNSPFSTAEGVAPPCDGWVQQLVHHRDKFVRPSQHALSPRGAWEVDACVASSINLDFWLFLLQSYFHRKGKNGQDANYPAGCASVKG